MSERLRWQDQEPVALGKLKRPRHQKGRDRGLDDVGAEMSERLRWQDPEPVALGKLKRLRHQKGRDGGLDDVGAKMWKEKVARSRTSGLEEVEKSQDVGKAETKTKTMDRLRCRRSKMLKRRRRKGKMSKRLRCWKVKISERPR